MSLRMFFVEQLSTPTVTLDEDTSKHIISVLRMEMGNQLLLTNGRGVKARATITGDNRKKVVVQVQQLEEEQQRTNKTAIAISLVKNTARFEWFLEKATEIGIDEIIPLICERTEKEKFRSERLQGILISAMLQSQQCWMPQLHEPIEFPKFIQNDHFRQKFIAHCEPSQKQLLSEAMTSPQSSRVMLIGPEGDFTSSEIDAALKNGFVPVSLGDTRLRTETAGIVSAVLLKNG